METDCFVIVDSDGRVIDHDDEKKKHEEANEFGAQLVREGHTCVDMCRSYPTSIIWCENKEVCVVKTTRKMLRDEGHTCLSPPEALGDRILWCGEQECDGTARKYYL